MNKQEIWQICIEEAKKSLDHDDVPIGALIKKDKNIISFAHNTRQNEKNILGHAEVNAILNASCKLKSWNLSDCELYVTLKPCSMCMEIIKQSRISKVYYLLDKLSFKKEYDKTEFLKENFANFEQEYQAILSNFFKDRR